MADARSKFKAEYGRCMICGHEWRSADYFPRVLETHEIARGTARSKAVVCRAAWLVLCREHHVAVGDLSKWPVARQLALKLIRDPEGFDRVAVNRLRGRQDEAITHDEVLACVEELRSWLSSDCP